MEYAVSSFADLNPHFPAHSANSANLGRDIERFVQLAMHRSKLAPETAVILLYRFRLDGNDKVKVNNSTFPHSLLPTPNGQSPTV